MAVLLVKAQEAQRGIYIGPTAANPVSQLRPSGFARIFILHEHIHRMRGQFADKLGCQIKKKTELERDCQRSMPI